MSGWYNPKDARRCWPEGEYDAVVEKAEAYEAKSSGNVGRKMTLRVYHGEQSMLLFDYLMAGEKTAWKIKEFAKAIGQVELFDAGEFDPINYIGSNVRVSLKIEDSDDFGEQNKVGKYLGGTAASMKPVAPKPAASKGKPASTYTGGNMQESDIPFTPLTYGLHPICI